MKKKFQTYLKKIDNKYLIVSPSDLGFHNILKYKKKLYFYDFEYAGLDDPIKLICDFFWHPGNNMSKKLKDRFLYKVN
jgi:thiamine kinase-like enzyme